MKEKYSVYVHVFPNNKKYIGITMRKPKYRWNNGKAYYHNQFMVRAIKKYGWENIEHKILYEHLTKEEAEQKEIELIKHYKTNDKKYGYNIENGGNHQGKMSETTKKLLSIAHKGKTIPKETRIKIKQTMKGRRQGISLINMKPINVYDINKKYIRSYECMNDCAKDMKIPIQHISLCCQGKIKKTHNFIFEYK